MAKLSTTELYVVYTGATYGSCASLAGDQLYTEKAEADAEAEALSKYKFAGMSVQYYVMTLSEWLSTVRDEAREEGRTQERQSHY